MNCNCPACLKFIDSQCTIKEISIKDGKCKDYLNPKEQRSLKQHDTYFKCVEVWQEYKMINDDGSINYDYNTKDKCHSQIRWAVKYIDRESVTHFIDKNGKSFLHFELDTISFKTPQKKANQYFDDAFKFMADELGITVEELIKEAKSRMHSK